jgi:hypothetical protein B2_15733
MRIFYVARDTGTENNGAGTVMGRNLKALQEIAGDGNVNVYTLPPSNMRNVFLSLLVFGSYGVTKTVENDVVMTARALRPDFIFIESTSFGSLIKRLEKIAPVIAFAHNLDTKLCREEIGCRPFWIIFPKLAMTRFNEAKTTKYANFLICLNQRDAEGFKKTFNREADIILPITFPSKDLSMYDSLNPADSPYYLFVGSDFFPNVEGIMWFIEKVAPNVDVDFHIVGSCCRNEKIKNLKLPGNVRLLGYVDDLDNEYYNASGVIAPIFKGSGMKTKTVEALSYGKSIFGTSEAFEGIYGDYAKIGGVCNTADDFITAINAADKFPANPYSMELFSGEYSDKSFIDKLASFLKENMAKK